MRSEAGDGLSPSAYHRRVMAHTRQALAYRGGDVGRWQRTLRRRLWDLVGRMPTRRMPLRVRSLWTREIALGRIEKIVFTAEPGADVPAYVCLPRDGAAPYPFFICLQGHTTGMHVSLAVDRDDETRPIAVEGDRDFALGCLRRGIAALCLEQRSMGERRERLQKQVSEQGCQDAAMQALMLGKTLIGERVFDVDRGIDYLAGRGDADLRCLGVMGNSGGGTISMFAAALLARIRLAMPSCSFCSFRDSIMSLYHCADNYIPGLLPVAEMSDIMGLFAPRPVVIVAGEKDDIFPIGGTLREFRKLKAIYRAAGAPERCHLVIGPEGHRFYAELAWPVMLRELQAVRGRPGVSGKR